MIAALLLSVACIPDNQFVTPTILGNHDRQDTALYRVYAKRPDDSSWPWVYDIPYVNDPDYGEFASSILLDWPVQRMIPSEISFEEVQFVIKAVDRAGNESAPSNVLTICMPLCEEFP